MCFSILFFLPLILHAFQNAFFPPTLFRYLIYYMPFNIRTAGSSFIVRTFYSPTLFSCQIYAFKMLIIVVILTFFQPLYSPNFFRCPTYDIPCYSSQYPHFDCYTHGVSFVASYRLLQISILLYDLLF